MGDLGARRWQISGDELEDSDLSSVTLTDIGTGWSATRVLGADEVAWVSAQVVQAADLAARTGATVTLDVSRLFPEVVDTASDPAS